MLSKTEELLSSKTEESCDCVDIKNRTLTHC